MTCGKTGKKIRWVKALPMHSGQEFQWNNQHQMNCILFTEVRNINDPLTTEQHPEASLMERQHLF